LLSDRRWPVYNSAAVRVPDAGRAMATGQQIEATYDYLDEVWRLSLGDCADITCAYFNGDYGKTLERAQADKHEYILDHVHFRPGMRVLDIGCGWGGLLDTVRRRGGRGVGLTLSPRQCDNARRLGLDARLLDWKQADPRALGPFDAVVSVGAFEHFCSEEEWRAGQQDRIYGEFFALCASLLPHGGRLYLQTITWGPRCRKPHHTSTRAPRGSDAYVVACLREFFPGSWLPYGLGQIRAAAGGAGFELESASNGRRDYVRTVRDWGRRLRRMSGPKLMALARLRKYLFSDPHFLRRLETIYLDYGAVAFQRNLWDHQRLTFVRKA
jgi:cyclopropane-fatty-acyl-phospholipid synthase